MVLLQHWLNYARIRSRDVGTYDHQDLGDEAHIRLRLGLKAKPTFVCFRL